jgi:hypothetical protein
MKTNSVTSKLKAFRVEVKDWPEATSIVRTTKAARAKFLAWSGANDVGYKLPFGDFRVRRAQKYDDSVSLKPDKCYSLDFVEKKFI